MSRSILLLRLEGPLQSWGCRARWDVRDTQSEPTKSGVIGLLGCALGYGIGDARLETELETGFRFGVRIEHPGAILEDYQTITDFLPTADGRFKHSGVSVGTSLTKIRSDPDARPATILSPRFYIEDAAFLVALEEHITHPGLAAKCGKALLAPVWPLYLGRKACIPTRPVLDSISHVYASLEEALRKHPWSWLGAQTHNRELRESGALLRLLVEPEAEGLGTVLRQDAHRAGPGRLYGFRMEQEVEPVEHASVSPRKGGS